MKEVQATSNTANFLHTRSRYRGEFNLPNLMFNDNMQEFAQKAGYICAFHTNGQLSSEQAYQDLQKLWQQLKLSYEELGIKE
jgi:hypothetical protein